MMIEALSGHGRILMDRCIWIYYLEDHPDYADTIETLLEQCREREIRLISSELSLLEIKIGPLRRGKDRIAAEYQLHMDRYPGLTIAPVSRAVINYAASLRAAYRLKTPDAIILATGLQHGATLAVTNDLQWQKVAGIEIMCAGNLV